MNELARIFANVRQNEADVIRLWKQRTQDAPWLRLPADAHVDHVPDLLRAIVDALLGRPDPQSARERVIRISVLHGEHRRKDGFDDTLLHHEHHLLRYAVWEVIRKNGSPEACFAAIARFDVVLTHTTSASLQGFHLGFGAPPLTEDGIVERMLSQDQPWPPPVNP